MRIRLDALPVHTRFRSGTISFGAVVCLFWMTWIARCHAETNDLPNEEHQGSSAQTLNREKLGELIISPSKKWVLITHQRRPSIKDLAGARQIIANETIDPKRNTWAIDAARFWSGLTLVRLADNRQWRLPVPEGRIGPPVWAPDSRQFSFRLNGMSGVELWIGNADTQEMRRITPPDLLGVVRGNPCTWMPDSQHVICQRLIPERGPKPEPTAQSATPVVLSPDTVDASAFAPLSSLSSEYEEALFEYYFTGQNFLIDVHTAQAVPIGKPGIYDYLLPSPNGEYLLSSRVVRPYSYKHPPFFFPRIFELLNARGEVIKVLGTRPANWLDISINGWAPPGLRRFSWVPDRPATLVFVETLDNGDPRIKTSHRDRLLRWEAPFEVPFAEILRTRDRMVALPEVSQFTDADEFANFAWLGEGQAWVEEYDHRMRSKRTWVVDTLGRRQSSKLLLSGNTEDVHSGNVLLPLLSRRDAYILGANAVVEQHGDWIYTVGFANSPGGKQPFLDRLHRKTGKRERVLTSAQGSYEITVGMLDPQTVITRHETPSSPPAYYLHSLAKHDRTLLTQDLIASASMKAIEQVQLSYRRDDGVHLTGVLCVPAGHRRGDPLPTVIWGYPMRYLDRDKAGNVRDSAYRYMWADDNPFMGLLCSLASEGYAVLWNASMPVVGGEDRNDTAVRQIVANAQAAIDKLVSLGVTDPSRVAVAGHSYGAVMAATLLAHSNLFVAGIALSGVYNLTNSPTGFQRETRKLWDAPAAYIDLSGLFHVNTITAPLLLVHGEEDESNVTPPSESRRMYQALASAGREARLVILPYESHVPRGQESFAYLGSEIRAWLDRWVGHRKTADGANVYDSDGAGLRYFRDRHSVEHLKTADTAHGAGGH